MTISVVIATYNRARLLRTTLDHLRTQAYQAGDEVIVVDNGSTDDTASVIAQHAAEFPVPLRTLRVTANGKGHSLNAAIAIVNGAILALTDDDVVVAADWIETIRDIFSDPAVALVGGRVDPNWEQEPPRWMNVSGDAGYGLMGSPLALQHYGCAQPLGARTAVGANLAVRRAVVDAVGGFAVELAPQRGTLLRAEDHEFCRRVRTSGYRCDYRPELQVRHWVPAARMRLDYLLRWFFWSGVAYAILGSDDPIGSDGTRRGVPHYHLRKFARQTLTAALCYLRGRKADAAVAAVQAAFAWGYVAHHKAPWSLGSPRRLQPVTAPAHH